MKNQNLSILSISLSIVAIGLSLFSFYKVGGFNFVETDSQKPDSAAMGTANTGKVEVSDDFAKEVYTVIDQYIADKQTEAGQPPQPTGPVEVSLDDDAMKGEEDAPVTIVEFTDFQCPYCERYFVDAYAKIITNYVDTGKVKYIVRDFPLPFHENAPGAANAAECIKDQGGDEMYFKYHDLLFKNQANLSVENYKKWAADFDIDQTEFTSCVDEEKFKAEIEADMKDGQTYGVQGTPAFFINGMPISGAQPYSTFEQAIEAALAEK